MVKKKNIPKFNIKNYPLKKQKTDYSLFIKNAIDKLVRNIKNNETNYVSKNLDSLELILTLLISEKFESNFEKMSILSNFLIVLNAFFHKSFKNLKFENDSFSNLKFVERFSLVYKKFLRFAINNLHESSLLLNFDLCLSILLSENFSSQMNMILRMALRIFIFDSSQRKRYLSKVISSYTKNQPYKKDFYIASGIYSKTKRKRISSLTVLYLTAIQSVSLPKSKDFNNKKTNTEIKTTNSEFLARYQDVTALIEDSLGELCTFVLLPQNNFDKNFQKEIFLCFTEDLCSALFLPEFSSASVILVYLLTFVTSYLVSDRSKSISPYVKSIFLSTVEMFVETIGNLNESEEFSMGKTTPSHSKHEAISSILSFYTDIVLRKSKDKFFLLLSRQFFVLNCASRFNKPKEEGNKIYDHLKNKFLERHLNPFKRDSLSTSRISLEEFKTLSFYIWESRKILEKLIDVKLSLKVLLFEGRNSIRTQAMRLFSLFIRFQPEILDQNNLFEVLLERSRDKSATIREIAVTILGETMEKIPKLNSKCGEILLKRSVDSSLMVRKRVVVSLYKEISLKPLETNKKYFVCILERINDEEKSVSKEAFESIKNIILSNKSTLQSIIQTLIEIMDDKLIEKTLAGFFRDIYSKSINGIKGKTELRMKRICYFVVDSLLNLKFTFSVKTPFEDKLSLNFKESYKDAEAWMRLFKILFAYLKFPEMFLSNYSHFSKLSQCKGENVYDLRISTHIVNHFLDILFATIGSIESVDEIFARSIFDDLLKIIETNASTNIKKAVPCICALFHRFELSLLQPILLLVDSNCILIEKSLSEAEKLSPEKIKALLRALVVIGLIGKHLSLSSLSESLSTDVITKQINGFIFQSKFCATKESKEKLINFNGIFNLLLNVYYQEEKFKLQIREYSLMAIIQFFPSLSVSKLSSIKFWQLLEKLITSFKNKNAKGDESATLINVVIKELLNLMKSVNMNKLCVLKSNLDRNINSLINPEKHLPNGRINVIEQILSNFFKKYINYFLGEFAFAGDMERRKNCISLFLNILQNRYTNPFLIAPIAIASLIDTENKIRYKSFKVLVKQFESNPSLISKNLMKGMSLSYDYYKKIQNGQSQRNVNNKKTPSLVRLNKRIESCLARLFEFVMQKKSILNKLFSRDSLLFYLKFNEENEEKAVESIGRCFYILNVLYIVFSGNRGSNTNINMKAVLQPVLDKVILEEDIMEIEGMKEIKPKKTEKKFLKQLWICLVIYFCKCFLKNGDKVSVKWNSNSNLFLILFNEYYVCGYNLMADFEILKKKFFNFVNEEILPFLFDLDCENFKHKNTGNDQ